MQTLRYESVEYIFGIPGATEVMFMDALERYPEMKYILGLHEVIAAGMAEGYARMSGKPGFLNLHTAPGLAAAMPMLINAQMGGVPLVVTAGQQDTRLILRDPHLTGDLVGMAKFFSKWQAEVLRAEDIQLAIQRAFKMAMQPPTGPAFVSLPQDIMDNKIEFEHIPNKPLFVELRPDQRAIDQAVDLLINLTYNKPVAMFVENGVARNNALPEVIKLAELIGARVYQPWMGDVNFPVQHPQYIGNVQLFSPESKDLFQSIEVLMIIGCPPYFNISYFDLGSILTKGIKIIQLDDNPWEIAKNFPVTVGIQGHIKASLRELIDNLEKNMSAKDKESAKIRISNIAKEKEAAAEVLRKQDDAEKNNVPISVSRLMQELRDTIKPGTVIVDDCWSSSQTLQRTLNLAEAKSFHRSRRGGSIGWGLPGAIGARLGAPDRPLIAVSGDGSAMWSIQSLWTASHYNIPVTFIIIANANYRQVKIMRKMFLGGELNKRHAGMDLDNPIIDFCRLAQSMGVRGDRVEHPDDLREIFKDALDSNEPRLIEIKVENRSTP